MFARVKQYGRASHLLKTQLLLEQGGFCTAAEIANLYHQEWLNTSRAHQLLSVVKAHMVLQADVTLQVPDC